MPNELCVFSSEMSKTWNNLKRYIQFSSVTLAIMCGDICLSVCLVGGGPWPIAIACAPATPVCFHVYYMSQAYNFRTLLTSFNDNWEPTDPHPTLLCPFLVCVPSYMLVARILWKMFCTRVCVRVVCVRARVFFRLRLLCWIKMLCKQWCYL